MKYAAAAAKTAAKTSMATIASMGGICVMDNLAATAKVARSRVTVRGYWFRLIWLLAKGLFFCL